jgi:hypothetical protein
MRGSGLRRRAEPRNNVQNAIAIPVSDRLFASSTVRQSHESVIFAHH